MATKDNVQLLIFVILAVTDERRILVVVKIS